MSEYRIKQDINLFEIVNEYTKRISRVIDEQTLANVENQLVEYGYVKRNECEMKYIDTYEYPDGEEDYLCVCLNCGRQSWEPAHNLPKFCGGCGRMVKR